MAKYRYRKQRLLTILLVAVLCLSLFAGRVTAATGCTASCCLSKQMSGHGHTILQIEDDIPCPCCSATASCTVEKNISPVTFAAVHHDGKRVVNPLFPNAQTKTDEHQETKNELASPIINPPTKIPIYITTLNLIRWSNRPLPHNQSVGTWYPTLTDSLKLRRMFYCLSLKRNMTGNHPGN